MAASLSASPGPISTAPKWLLALSCAALVSAGSLCTSCQQHEQPTACYALINEGDTLRLSLFTLQPTVTGVLQYDDETDHYIGSISGTMHGDTLLGMYSGRVDGFMMGIPVAFLRRANGYAKGNGEFVMQGVRPAFKQTSAIRFDNLLLKPVPCSN